jgi:energy-converting hydrogenase A subunit M
MEITLDELRRIKHTLPQGSISRIAKELNIDEQEVRDFFSRPKLKDAVSDWHYEPGHGGGVIKLHNTSILDCAKKILNESSIRYAMQQDELRKRTKVLETALFLEGLTSKILCLLLDIDTDNSKSLGNKSSALSFNSKINMLSDMRSLQKEDGSKFEKFMSIRNQFMHTFSANSYQNCVSHIDGLDKWLLKNYPQDDKLDLETKYEKSIDALSQDLIRIASNLVNLIEDKAKKEAKNQINEKMLSFLFKNLKEVSQQFDEFIEAIIDNKETIDFQKLKGKGEKFRFLIIEKAINSVELEEEE